MRLAIMLGYAFENMFLRRRVSYPINRHIVVEGEKNPTSLHAAADSRITGPHFRHRNYVRARSSLVEAGAFA